MQQAAAGTALRTIQALRVCSSAGKQHLMHASGNSYPPPRVDTACCAGTSTSAVLGSVSLWTPDAFNQWQCKRWATKKQGGSTKNKADSNPKHLGCKMLEGELIFPGQIIVRQRGTRFRPGLNVGLGKDHTIFSKSVGHVHFRRETRSKEGRPMQELRVIDVLPLEGDHTPGYKERVAAMVAARAQLRARMLGLRAKYN